MRSLYLLILITTLALRVSGGGIRHITMRDGLSSRQVYELEGDGDGFVWMYTNSGLERYDGYRFKHYQLVQREEKSTTSPQPQLCNEVPTVRCGFRHTQYINAIKLNK